MSKPIVVAGHICLDVIPTFAQDAGPVFDLLVPGKLVNVGRAVVGTGGAVSNTGLALHRLGLPVRLMGKVSDDLFGGAVLDVLRRHDPALAHGMIVAQGGESSYTIVINPPGTDRFFLHCPGANDTFEEGDIQDSALAGAALFHFGYPPLMRRMFCDGGLQLERLFQRVGALGIVTSLDLAKPDPESEAGKVDWVSVLERVLPHVDVFLPSYDEILFMLDRRYYEELELQIKNGRRTRFVEVGGLERFSTELLEMGAGVVGLKLGDQGLYLRTAQHLPARLTRLVGTSWAGRELLAPCFQAEVAGTTGAGDCTIAGFLAGLTGQMPIEEAMTTGVAVGAASVEKPDSVSGVPPLAEIQRRREAGWSRHAVAFSLPGWKWASEQAVWIGPHDRLD